MDKFTAILAVARNLGDLVIDTTLASLSNATGTIFLDVDKLIHPITGQLKGFNHYIYEGSGVGEEHVVTDFLPANNRLIFNRLFTGTPNTSSKFALFKHFRKDEYDNALNRILGVAKLQYLEEKVATLELVASQYEYPSPSGFEYISRLRLVPSGSTDYGADDEVSRIFELPPRFFRIEPNAVGTFMIVIDPRKIDLDDFNETWINVLGQAKADVSPTDNATIPVDLEEYLISGASMLLAAQRVSENQEWRTKFKIFRDFHKSAEPYIHRPRYGKRVGA